MRAPFFMRLAELDDQRFITACRHGLVHLTWKRTTTRFTRDEFRQLAALLQRAEDAPPPATFREGAVSVSCRLDGDCELRMGGLVLLLAPKEFGELAQAAGQAVQRLDKILASGVWDRGESEPPPDYLERLRRTPFSHN